MRVGWRQRTVGTVGWGRRRSVGSMGDNCKNGTLEDEESLALREPHRAGTTDRMAVWAGDGGSDRATNSRAAGVVVASELASRAWSAGSLDHRLYSARQDAARQLTHDEAIKMKTIRSTLVGGCALHLSSTHRPPLISQAYSLTIENYCLMGKNDSSLPYLRKNIGIILLWSKLPDHPRI